MICSFRHRGLKRLYERSNASGIRPDLLNKVRTILARLDAAQSLDGLRVPAFRLHALKGDMKGYWAVTVRANWRIIFRFEDGHAYDVELIDYH
ncbi:MAG: type II toxin-antitoxin system RelE/ParE family toxin [Acidobacteriota bacterium]